MTPASGSASGDQPTAVVFRKRLLPWSETFIAAQVGAMTRYRPLLVGYSRDPRGTPYLEGRDQLLLDDHGIIPGLSRLLLKATGRMPQGWLDTIVARRPAVVHAHFGTNAPPAIRIARTLKRPVIVTYHGVDITAAPRNEKQRKQRSAVFAAADRVIAVSQFIADSLRAAGCAPQKTLLHYIGVDTDFFSPRPGPRPANRILFVGRLVTKKGLIHLIRAMPRVRQTAPDAEVVVAGDGPLRPAIEREAALLRVPVTFLGVQTPVQVRELMRGATVLCGPGIVAGSGDTEGLPISFLEAQATGLPVVVSTSGGSEEGVVHDETGFLHRPGDEAAIAEHLLALLTDPQRRAAFGGAARAHILERFDLRRQTAKLEDIYDSVRR
jgi:colanic acid/amylovoran biosynthesis glycosyltransferase